MDVIKMDMDMDMGVMPGLMLALSKAETVRAGTYKIPIKGTDMVVTFQSKLDESDKGVIYAALAEGLVKALGMTAKVLLEVAIRNGMKKRPAVLRPLKNVMSEIVFGTNEDSTEDLGDGLVFASCESGMSDGFGAACLLYPGFLKMAGERLGGGFYILPSSRHELLFLPAMDVDNVNAQEMREKVRTINQNEVEERDRLSDEIYFSKGGKFFHVNVNGALDEINLEALGE